MLNALIAVLSIGVIGLILGLFIGVANKYLEVTLKLLMTRINIVLRCSRAPKPTKR